MLLLGLSAFNRSINKMLAVQAAVLSSLRSSFLFHLVDVGPYFGLVGRVRVLQFSPIVGFLLFVFEFRDFRWLEISDTSDRGLSCSLRQFIFVLLLGRRIRGLIMVALFRLRRLGTRLSRIYLYGPPIFCAVM